MFARLRFALVVALVLTTCGVSHAAETPATLDGGTLSLYSHGNLNVIDSPQIAKQADKQHGTIALVGGKYTVQFPNAMPGAKFVSKE